MKRTKKLKEPSHDSKEVHNLQKNVHKNFGGEVHEMVSPRGGKRTKLVPTASAREEGECYCLLCKVSLTLEKGLPLTPSHKLPLSGLDLISLLRCYNITLTVLETMQLQERSLMCKQCYKLLIKGDSAYNYMYSVASKMHKVWSGGIGEPINFSLNLPDLQVSSGESVKSDIRQDSEKCMWQCIYCENKFCNEIDLHVHLKSIHNLKLGSHYIKINKLYQNQTNEMYQNKPWLNSKKDNTSNPDIKEEDFVIGASKFKHNVSLLAPESKVTVLPNYVRTPGDKQNELETEHNTDELHLKGEERQLERVSLSVGNFSRIALEAKQELLLQEEENEVILSYLLGNDESNEIGTAASKLSLGSNCNHDNGNVNFYNSSITQKRMFDLDVRQNLKTHETDIAYRTGKGMSEAVERKQTEKKGSFNFEVKQEINYKNFAQPLFEREKNEESSEKTFPPIVKCDQQAHAQFIALDEETRSVCGDDALTNVENNQVYEGYAGEDILKEGGCTVVDIYDGPVNLSDERDDFRCIIISER